MSAYGWAWLLVIVMAAVGGLSTFKLLRPVNSLTVRLSLTAVVIAVFITPTSIPKFDGYAPAFIVFLFEALFQAEGEPAGALIALLAGVSIAAVASLVVGYLLGRRQAG